MVLCNMTLEAVPSQISYRGKRKGLRTDLLEQEKIEQDNSNETV